MKRSTHRGARRAAEGEFDALFDYLLEGSRRCLRPPVDRFRHPWLAPMPLSPGGEAYLRARAARADTSAQLVLSRPDVGDGFKSGDYSLGLFHHDASEAAIELLLHPDLREAAAGSLLVLLDAAEPSGLVHRAELSHKAREREPSKPVLAQFALRAARAFGARAGPAWLRKHEVVPRVERFLGWYEEHYTGLHGLLLTHSALQSGFDSDLLTAALPDRSVEGPDTNAFMVLEYQAMAELCALVGRSRDAPRWRQRAEELTRRINDLLWYEDGRGGFYVGLRWVHGVGSWEGEVVGQRDASGKVVPFESWTGLLPLYAGVPTPARARKLVRRLLDPERFWGPVGVRTAPRDSVYFHQAPRVMLYDHKKQGHGPVSNWGGPVWVLSSYYLAVGLERYGYLAQARELALKTARLLANDLAATGRLHECYDDTGRGLWPREGTFLSWNVLARTLARLWRPSQR